MKRWQLLPAETWLSVMEFCTRAELGRAVSLCCRRFHALAHPLMHERGARRIQTVMVFADPGNAQAFYTRAGRWDSIPDHWTSLDFDDPLPLNILSINLSIHTNVTPGVRAFIAFLARHGRIHELAVCDWVLDEVLRDLLAHLQTLFVPRPQFSILHISIGNYSLSHKSRAWLCQPILLELPAIAVSVGHTAQRVGPLLNWLHWPAAEGSAKSEPRMLRISLLGDASELFLDRFLNALVQRFLTAKRVRRFRVVLWAQKWIWPPCLSDDPILIKWPTLEAQPVWHNARTREVLRVVEVPRARDPDAGPHLRVFHIERRQSRSI